MSLKQELERLIKASHDVQKAYQDMKDGRYAQSLKDDHRNKMYDLKTATKRAEEELKKNHIDLFS